MSRSTSEFSVQMIRPSWVPNRSATSSAPAMAISAMVTEMTPDSTPAPANRVVSTGRYTAIERSSMTSRDNTIGVSRLPNRPRSARSLAVIPELVAYVMPAIATTPGNDQPMSTPTTAPGAALAIRLTTPAGACWRRLVTSSGAEYSRPSNNSSRTTPICAPAEMNASLAPRCTNPPVPMASPANR